MDPAPLLRRMNGISRPDRVLEYEMQLFMDSYEQIYVLLQC